MGVVEVCGWCGAAQCRLELLPSVWRGAEGERGVRGRGQGGAVCLWVGWMGMAEARVGEGRSTSHAGPSVPVLITEGMDHAGQKRSPCIQPQPNPTPTLTNLIALTPRPDSKPNPQPKKTHVQLAIQSNRNCPSETRRQRTPTPTPTAPPPYLQLRRVGRHLVDDPPAVIPLPSGCRAVALPTLGSGMTNDVQGQRGGAAGFRPEE